MESIGAYLRRERELRNIPLTEVSEQTRVKIEYLEAMESEHFEKIPGMTFARGYLKAYAQYVGLDPEDVLLRFEGFIGQLSGKPIYAEPVKGQRLFWLVTFLVLLISATLIILWLRK